MRLVSHENVKTALLARFLRLTLCELFLRLLRTLLEAFDATGLVEGAIFARVERVRLARDFNRYLRVFLTFERAGLSRVNGRTNEELLARSDVLEDDLAVVCRMDVLFHVSRLYQKHKSQAMPGFC